MGQHLHGFTTVDADLLVGIQKGQRIEWCEQLPKVTKIESEMVIAESVAGEALAEESDCRR